MRFYKNVLTLPRQSHTIKTYNLLHRSKALRRLSCVQGKGMVMKMIEYYHELEEPELLTLQDEEGVESVVELLAQMDVDGKSYVAATPHLDDPTQALGEDAELIGQRRRRRRRIPRVDRRRCRIRKDRQSVSGKADGILRRRRRSRRRMMIDRQQASKHWF